MQDKLITNILPISDIKALYIETLLNNTNNISKVTDLSVLNAHAFAVAKLLQKDLKETAILESQIFPQLAHLTYLDNAAKLVGGLTRLSATGSSTYVLVIADSGTQYVPGETTFVSSKGTQFNIEYPTQINDNGYGYIAVKSIGVGANTNVDALTINVCNNPPTGHSACTNEYQATGGRDAETDEDFKIRLSTFGNLAAKETQLNILENLKLYDNRILRILKNGFSDDGKIQLALMTCDGSAFTSEELLTLESKLSNFISLSDLNYQGNNIGIELTNVTYTDINIAFYVDIISGFSTADVRRSIQINLTKYLDFRYWNKTNLEWTRLWDVVVNTKGVNDAPDNAFVISTSTISSVTPPTSTSDIAIPILNPPRIKQFVIYDMTGTVLYDNNSVVLPIYYPA